MTDALVAYSADRGIARIALDSPRNRNALSAALMTQLEEALAAAVADDGGPPRLTRLAGLLAEAAI